MMGNDTIKTAKINRELGYVAVIPDALISYNFIKGMIDEEEAILVASDPHLHLLSAIDWNLLATDLQAYRPQRSTYPTNQRSTLSYSHHAQYRQPYQTTISQRLYLTS